MRVLTQQITHSLLINIALTLPVQNACGPTLSSNFPQRGQGTTSHSTDEGADSSTYDPTQDLGLKAPWSLLWQL